VGDYVLKEIRFLGPDFLHVDSQIAYNGVPCWKISSQERMGSRQKLRAYCNTLLGYEPDYVFSHVTRLVPSKGLWRDLRVLEHVERILRARNESAVMYTLSTEVPSSIARVCPIFPTERLFTTRASRNSTPGRAM
jgi:hypothetical protein